jgi:hypothetical protein
VRTLARRLRGDGHELFGAVGRLVQWDGFYVHRKCASSLGCRSVVGGGGVIKK